MLTIRKVGSGAQGQWIYKTRQMIWRNTGLRENTREKASVSDVGEEGNWDKKRNQK